MTTIKSTLGWLFGIYRDNALLQIVLRAVIFIHAIVIGSMLCALYLKWLITFLYRLFS